MFYRLYHKHPVNTLFQFVYFLIIAIYIIKYIFFILKPLVSYVTSFHLYFLVFDNKKELRNSILQLFLFYPSFFYLIISSRLISTGILLFNFYNVEIGIFFFRNRILFKKCVFFSMTYFF